jgi:hypothetical protein
MILSGEEIQALLGAMMVYEFVPFRYAAQPQLSDGDVEIIEAIRNKLRLARSSITPNLPRSTPGWLDRLHAAQVNVNLTEKEAAALKRIGGICLLELRTDGDLSAHVGGVHLSALRIAHRKLVEHARD